MNLFVPERVTNLICTAPCPELSAPEVAAETVTSSTMSRRGCRLAKKPSPDRVYLSCTLAPSTVTDSVLCGSPMMVDWRKP